MAGRSRWWAVLLWGILAPAALLTAQQLPTQILTEDDGLPSTDVKEILQDRDGKLWIATRAGLGIFDGTSWKAAGFGEGLPSTGVLAVFEDSVGEIWLVLSDSQVRIARRTRGRWQLFQNLQETVPIPVRQLVVARLSEPYLLISGGGEGGIWRGGSWRPLESPESWNDPQLYGSALHADGKSFWWVGEGIALHRPGGEARFWELPDSLESPILGVLSAGDGLWLAGPSWVGFFDPEDSQEKTATIRGAVSLPLRIDPRPGRVKIAEDGHGGAVVAGPDHIFWIHGENVVVLGPNQGLGAASATDLLLDREGSLWFTSNRGVTKVRSLGAFGLDRRFGLLGDEVSAVAELADGSMVFGHHGGLSFWRDGEVWVETIEGVDGDPRVMDLLEVEAGSLWLAVGGGGGLVRRREAADGGVSWTRWSREEGVGSQLSGLTTTEEGLWISGQEGVSRFDGETFFPQEVPRYARRIASGPRGKVYAATYGHGLWIRELDGSWIQAQKEPFKGRIPTSLYTVLPTENDVWVGASDGLYRLEGNRLVKEEGIGVKRPVYALNRDADQNLWLGTDKGVFRWDGRSVRRFGLGHGLLGLEVNRAAVTTDSEGRLWVGTQAGVTRFDFAYERPLPELRAEVVSLEVGDETYDPERGAVLAHDRNRPVFGVRPKTLIDEEPLDVAVRLGGLEENFTVLEDPGSPIRYGNLPAGSYRLQVKARWEGGEWGPVVSSGEVVVSRPWWQTWWFRALTAFGLMGLIWLTGRGIFVHRYSRRLAVQVETRTAALEELTARLREEIEEHKRTEADLRVATAAAEQASRAKSSFLAAMSHEIRTPMNGILGIAHLLEREDLRAAQAERVRTLKRSGEALLEILDDILDYSKIEAGSLEIDLYRFDLRALLLEVANLFEPVAAEKGLSLELDGIEGVSRWVLGDGSRLRQVLINLVGNAVKFTERGSVRIGVAEEDSRIVLRVIDSGIGIREEAQGQLFRPFHQLESGHHRRHGGTGLGLAISQRLVTAMGGEITVSSRPGEGSTFSLWLPLPAAEEPTPAEAPRSPADGRLASRHPMRILLAEDNPINQTIMVDMLEELGYAEVATAENGVEVIAALEEDTFDLILMDLQMPVLGGLAASRRIVAQMGEDRPRLVALTAHAFQADREACFEAGMDDHLPKPVSFEALVRTLERWAPGSETAAD